MYRYLIVVEDYPNLCGGKALMYVHTRCIAYMQAGMSITVLNFSSEKEYTIDGIRVIPVHEFIKNEYEILIMHAPNIRHHFVFLLRYGKFFKGIVLFFHGHEIVKINKVYPKNYRFNSVKCRMLIQNVYDWFKLSCWRYYLPTIRNRLSIVFVSSLLQSDFDRFVHIKKSKMPKTVLVINNGIGLEFEINKYNLDSSKEYDFITIRSNLDSSVYCIDLLCSIANNNPDKKFLLIGRGSFFAYNKKPDNITLVNAVADHRQLIEFLNSARAAIMLTRRDSQGLMACEIASFGMPMITSNISICHEMLGGFPNVLFVDNEKVASIDLSRITVPCSYFNNTRFYQENTVDKEIRLLQQIGDGGSCF